MQFKRKCRVNNNVITCPPQQSRRVRRREKRAFSSSFINLLCPFRGRGGGGGELYGGRRKIKEMLLLLLPYYTAKFLLLSSLSLSWKNFSPLAAGGWSGRLSTAFSNRKKNVQWSTKERKKERKRGTLQIRNYRRREDVKV